MSRANDWAYRHPWGWAVVGGALAFVSALIALRSIVIALAIAPVWFLVTGWSVSRGPGRKYLERRLRR